MLGWVDDEEQKWSDERKIYPPSFIGANPQAVIVIMCMTNYRKIVNFIKSNGWGNDILVYPQFRYTWFDRDREGKREWCNQNTRELFQIYHIEDFYTRQCLQELLYQRCMDDFRLIELERMIEFEHIHQYFYDKAISPAGDFTFVDGGSYTGDSIEEVYADYQNKMRLVYAFEPDKVNLSELKSLLSRLHLDEKVKVLPYGLWDEDKISYFSTEQNSSVRHVVEESQTKIQMHRLDSVIEEVEGDLCIKMDIEGAEIPALHGASRTIEKYHPYLAICVYHRFEDILEIPKLIKKIRSDYDFYLRSGCHTECYAVPRK